LAAAEPAEARAGAFSRLRQDAKPMR